MYKRARQYFQYLFRIIPLVHRYHMLHKSLEKKASEKNIHQKPICAYHNYIISHTAISILYVLKFVTIS